MLQPVFVYAPWPYNSVCFPGARHCDNIVLAYPFYSARSQRLVLLLRERRLSFFIGHGERKLSLSQERHQNTGRGRVMSPSGTRKWQNVRNRMHKVTTQQWKSNPSRLQCVLCAFRIAYLVPAEQWTYDRKVADFIPRGSGRRIVILKVDFMCWHLFGVCSVPVLLKRHAKDLGNSARSVVAGYR